MSPGYWEKNNPLVISPLIQLTNRSHSKRLVTIAQTGNNLENKFKKNIFSTVTFRKDNIRLMHLRLLYAWAQFFSLCFMTNKDFVEWQEKKVISKVISREKRFPCENS